MATNTLDATFTLDYKQFTESLKAIQAAAVATVNNLTKNLHVSAHVDAAQINNELNGIVKAASDAGTKAGKALTDHVTQQTKGIGATVQNAFKGKAGDVLGALGGGGIVGLATNPYVALAGAIFGVGKAMISTNQEFETYKTQLTTLLGSADLAKDRIEELAKFGAETPFDLPELIKAEKVLIGFGLQGEKALKLTGKSAKDLRTVLGDVAAGTGQSFEELSVTFGKLSSGATGEALSRFQELGIVTKEQLKAMGVEFDKAGSLLSPLPVAMQAVTQQMEAKFGGGMAALSKTAGGQLSTLKDNFDTILREIGGGTFDVFKDSVAGLNEFLGSDGFQKVIADVSQYIGLMIKSTIEYGKTLFALLEVGFKQTGLIFNIVASLFGGFNSKGKEAVGVMDVISGAFKGLQTTLQGLQIYLNGVSGALDAISKGSIFDVFSGFKDGAEQAANEIKEANIAEAAAEQAEKLKEQVSTALNEGLEIKANIDKNGELEKVIQQFKNAKTEAEKNSLAKVIADQAPGAITGIKNIVDANGQLQTVYEVNTEKAEEFQKAQTAALNSDLKSKQDDFLKGFQAQAKTLDENKQKLTELGQKITEAAAAGKDTEKLRNEFTVLKAVVSENQTALNGTIASARELGINGSADIIKMAKELGYSEEAAFKLATEVQKVTEALKDAKGLAEEFDGALSKTSGNVKTLQSALAQNSLEQKKLAKDTTEAGKQRLLELKAQAKELQAQQLADFKANKQLEATADKFDLEAKEKARQDANKKAEDASKKLREDREKAEKESIDQLAKLRIEAIQDARKKELAQQQANFDAEILKIKAREDLLGTAQTEARKLLSDQFEKHQQATNDKFDKQEQARILKTAQLKLTAELNSAKSAQAAITEAGVQGEIKKAEAQRAILEKQFQIELSNNQATEEEKTALASATGEERAALQKAIDERVAAQGLAIYGQYVQSKIDLEKAIIEKEELRKAQAITDLPKRELELKLIEIRSRYDAEITAAQGNAALIADIEERKNAEIATIQEKYNRKTNALYDTTFTIKEGLEKAFTKTVDEEAEKQREIKRGELRKESNDLQTEFSKGEITYKEFSKRRLEIAKQRAELETTSESTLQKSLKGITEGTLKSLSNAQNLSAQLGSKAVNDFLSGAKESLQSISFIGKEGVANLMKAGQSALNVISKQAEEGTLTWKSAAKTVLSSAFDFLQSMIPIWSAQILAGSLATPQSILTAGGAGLVQWAAMTTAIQAAVTIARGALGFEKGGLVPGGEKLIRINEKGQEYVHDAQTTAKYLNSFEALRQGLPPEVAFNLVPGKVRDAVSRPQHGSNADVVLAITNQNNLLAQQLSVATQTENTLHAEISALRLQNARYRNEDKRSASGGFQKPKLSKLPR